ncbi:macro domain-containing protein PG1779 isoform X2 [Anabrus simplex]|uniref:macro domain-containing protein PG1779 isoform X2 n=1 Tax=Anabrus simplex TaxID=316456 RepID=UPI0035A2B9D6
MVRCIASMAAGSRTNFESVEKWDEHFLKHKEDLKRQLQQTYNKTRQLIHPEEIAVRPDLNAKVSLWKGDITKLQIDAIVNAANSSLMGGGGVDGAIHRAAGPKLVEECATLGGCPTGMAKITGGYSLPAKHVIHTVGPRGQKPDLLESCYKTCLQLMLENKLRSVAFPCISTGIYGYPQEPAAHVALSTVRKFLEKNPNMVDRVIFCLFLAEDVKIYQNLMQVYFPVE